MIFTRMEISDVVVIDPAVHGDDRGYFIETFRQDKLEKFLGFKVSFCQDNESKSNFGVLRGLHYQLPPYAQSKLVRVITGEVLDVAVDLRKDSATFGKHVAVKLSGENKRQLFVPRGFAHGFVVLSETCTFAYKVDSYYNPECDRGIAFDDTEIDIDWIVEPNHLKLSAKDSKLPKFSEISSADYFNFSENLYA